jgi:flagella basal body P-ring formation protein FlgA
MTQRALVFVLFAASAWAATPVCTSIEGDQILGSDLARAVPAFRVVPPDTRIAPAPLPGGMRVFTEPELETMGARYGLRIPVLSPAVCFRVSTAPLNRDAVLAAMRRSLNMPEARIELEDISSEPTPPGVISFPMEMLGRPASPDGPALWRGEIVSGNRRFNIWARVRVLAPVKHLVAAEDLRQGVPVQAGQIREEKIEGFPALAKTAPVTADSLVGLLPTRTIFSGSEIKSEYLTRPLDVARGDLVHVEVRLGRARLALTARAESAGRMGDMIAVRNPESSRIFQARVEGKDRVLVDPHGAGED